MYKRFEFRWLKHFDFLVIDMLALQLAFVIAYFCRYGFTNPYSSSLYRKVAVLLLVVHGCVSFFDEAYGGILRRGYLKEVVATIKHVILVLLFLILYVFVTDQNQHLSRLFFLFLFVSAVVCVSVFRFLQKIFVEYCDNRSRKKYNMLLISKSENIEEVLANLQRMDRRIIGICFVDSDRVGEKIDNIPVVANSKSALDWVRDHVVDGVFVSLSAKDSLPSGFLDTCLGMGVSTHIGLYASGEEGTDQMVERIGEYMALTRSVRIATIRQLFIKRMIDICAGLIGVVVVGICWLFVAPAIYVKSPGPIFFSQTRVGRNGRKFKIYKFRSMYMDAEERKQELMEQNKIADGMMFKMDDDPRIIKGIGNFIRDYSIDELPQLWNVLKGEMSLVGTRPPTVDEYEKYDYHHKIRLSIKPGITGMWQVSGRSNITDFEEVVRLDASYITNWSLGLDVKILLRTVKVVLLKEGSA